MESTGQILFRPADIAFIYFDSPGKQIAPRSHHGAAQPVQHRPGGLMPAEAEDVWQAQGAGSVLLRRPPPHGLKPQPKRNMRVLKCGSGRHGNLMPAVVTPQQRDAHRRILLVAATRTTRTLRPQLSQAFPAVVIAAKACAEFLQVTRIVFHAPASTGCMLVSQAVAILVVKTPLPPSSPICKKPVSQS